MDCIPIFTAKCSCPLLHEGRVGLHYALFQWVPFPPILFYLRYNPVLYFESKHHPAPYGTLFQVEIITFNYNC